MTQRKVVNDDNSITGPFNRLDEEVLDQKKFRDDETLIYVGEELPEDEVEQNTIAEIQLHEMGSRAASFGFVARRVSDMIEEGEHIPQGETTKIESALFIPGLTQG